MNPFSEVLRPTEECGLIVWIVSKLLIAAEFAFQSRTIC